MPAKLALFTVVLVVVILLGLSVTMVYKAQSPSVSPTPQPTPVPSVNLEPLVVNEPNPFTPEVMNPFEDSTATNPFTTPTPSTTPAEEYANPFSDL